MHHKFLFTLAGIFLAVAFIVSTVTFVLQAQVDVENYSGLINDPSQVTAPNVTYPDPFELAASHSSTTIFVLVVEVVFISLFVVCLYLGINHYHGQYEKNKNTVE